MNRSLALIRDKSPLVLNITNYVAMNFTANALLAIGASPIMSFCPEEMEELVAGSDAVVINIGCADDQQVKAMKIAAKTAFLSGIPWVLDPAGVGASTYRQSLCKELVMDFMPSIIRGNASEILCLSHLCATDLHDASANYGHGVDSIISSADAVEAAKALALVTEAVVSISGEVDYITDGHQVASIYGGHWMMPRVTAMGCTATAITAAFAAVVDSNFDAACQAMELMSFCGERAAALAIQELQGEETDFGCGTFACKFIDALSTFLPDNA